MTATLAERAIALLERLVGFDTTSRDSNLALIEWVEGYLRQHGVASVRVPNADGSKTNLLASLGPMGPGGVVLSGHTDVVPVDGQPWTSAPFVLTRRDGKLFGRGTCDMKGFLALALALVPDLAAARLSRPVHLALTYDEEIGCLGAPALIQHLLRAVPAPDLVLVGEPTSMRVVGAHKGILYHEVTIRGREAHSSQPHLGASANMVAARIMGALAAIAERLERDADPSSAFEPKGASLTIGQVHGGTAPNILALDCRFVFDLRAPVDVDTRAVIAEIQGLVDAEDAALRGRVPDGGVVMRRTADVPAFHTEPHGAAVAIAQRLAGDNGPPRSVSYGAEAGQYRSAGLPTVLCGPGSIDQAHQPDEYIEIAQMERGAAMMSRLLAEVSGG